LNYFEEGLRHYLNKNQIEKIRAVKIGIAGAGGLGSNCAFNLARSGFNDFKIVDFDSIEATNLNRQFYFYDQINMQKVEALKANLMRINPDIKINAIVSMINEENITSLFDDCHIVVEAFDKVEYKRLIVEKYYSSGKLLVSASGLGGWGNSDDIIIRRVHSNFYVVGDMISEVSESIPPISPRVNIVAAKQADIILNYVLEGDFMNG